MRLSQLEDAEKALCTALDLHKQVKSRRGEANDLQQLGQLYNRLNRVEDAKKVLDLREDIITMLTK